MNKYTTLLVATGVSLVMSMSAAYAAGSSQPGNDLLNANADSSSVGGHHNNHNGHNNNHGNNNHGNNHNGPNGSMKQPGSQI